MGAAFLEAITLVRTLPCLAEPGKIIVVGTPSRSLAEVIPFLATLPNVIIFNPHVLSLTLRRQPGLISLEPEQASITQVVDAAEGIELLGALTAAINATWEHRAELVPATGQRRAPRPLEAWALLPHSNCKECGEATCMAFAFGLIQDRHELAECTVLTKVEAMHDRRLALQSLLGQLPLG
jgi:ArsR family metal-binding transcriptional regulator